MTENKNKGTVIGRYLKLPLWIMILWPLLLVALFFIDIRALVAGAAAAVIYAAVVLVFYFKGKRAVNAEMIRFAEEYDPDVKKLVDDIEVPFAVCDETGTVLRFNNAFKTACGEACSGRPLVKNLFPDCEGLLPADGEPVSQHVRIGKKSYRIIVKSISDTAPEEPAAADEETAEEGGKPAAKKGGISGLYAIHLYDETEILYLKKEWRDNQLVAGLIYMDNYEEALEGLEDVRKSLLVALVDRRITNYFSKYQCILRKLEKDKYLFVMAWKYLEDMREKKFSLLEETKSVNIGNDMSVTVSVGIGIHGDSFAQSYEYARIAMDLALGRGGDQVVLKDKNDVEYFGGKSHSMEKSTRVKARVKAHALQEIIESKEKIFCMGHHLSDIDALGAAVGVCRAAITSGKKAYIVLDTIIGSVKPLLERMEASGDYTELFISGEKALEMLDDNTVVCVVDVNRPAMTECPELLKKAKRIVVIDHHRQTSEKIDNAVLSYVEPYASSACEMVAEILQYYADGVKLKSVEADAMYAGIIVDTDHFNSKTGIRTFEAAAFLRRSGADSVRVRKMFREDMLDYRVKADAIKRAELYLDRFVISSCVGQTKESMNVVAAQAANELLNINGIQASFVLSNFENKVFISARSIDDVNVQIIMERLGGGGHMSIAGAQVENSTIDEVKEKLMDVLLEMSTVKAI